MISWREICENPLLKDLPYRIETNRFDQIVMTPAPTWRGGYRAEIGVLLGKLLPCGRVIVGCAIETADGTKVPDVIWISQDRLAPYRRAPNLPVCPEICVEILSGSNSLEEMVGKMKLYFKKGAQEVWLCDGDGVMSFFAFEGAMSTSRMCLEFPTQIDWD